MISGIFTSLAFAGFLGIVAWAYSRRNRARFDDAAQLPLTDESELQLRPGQQMQTRACCNGDKR